MRRKPPQTKYQGTLNVYVVKGSSIALPLHEMLLAYDYVHQPAKKLLAISNLNSRYLLRVEM